MRATPYTLRFFSVGIAAILLLPLISRAQSVGSAEIEYRGEKFKLTKSYSDYDDYKNDANNIDLAEVPRIERMMSAVKIGPEFSNWAEFAHQAFAIKFPGYGFSGGPKVKAGERQFQVTTIEIPRTSKDRYFVLEKFGDGKLRLVDDFVMRNQAEGGYAGVSSIELVSDELIYFDRNRSVVRSAKVSGEALDLHVRADNTFDIDGRAMPTRAELERFLREHRPARIHIVSSPGASYKIVKEALQAIQASGGADIGLVGNEAPQ
jgi:hypothetical protein